MTIAAGFVCLDGIVLCADTQETISGYTKNSTQKVRWWEEGGLRIAITAAGNTELIETVGGRIEYAIYSEFPQTGFWPPETVRELIQREISASFLTYMSPYATFPSYDRPSCEFLILIAVSNGASEYECLFRATGTTVREIKLQAECVGSGSILAKSLIERFFHMGMNLDETVLVACYVMYQTKKWIDGCGGKTDLIIFSRHKGFFGGIASWEIEALERQFEGLEASVNWLITDLVNPNRSMEEIDKLFASAKKTAARARNELYDKHERLLEIITKFAPYHRGRI